MSRKSGNLGKLIGVLGQDADDHYKLLLSDDRQLVRRSVIRSFFAYVEGLTYVLKQATLEYSHKRPGEYTTAELALLNEETYGFNNKGESFARRKFLPTAENFLFAMHTFLRRIPNVHLDVQIGGPEWQEFCKALQIRHRIVHPKAASDMEISDAEKESIIKVIGWFSHMVSPSYSTASSL